MKLLIMFVVGVVMIKCAPLKRKKDFPQVPSASSLEFMQKYGYLESDDGDTGALYTEEGITEALKILQLYGNIPQTGRLDNATLNLMKSQRCGVPDIIKKESRFRRFVLVRGWDKRKITYFVSNWSPHMDETTVVNNIQKALDIWGQYGHLKFIRSSSPDADIIVAFGRGQHGDTFPFDGVGGVLAHAFFPNSGLGGDIHFDDDEPWSDVKNGIGTAEGTDFFTVALHELGHSLGLQHSPVASSIMFPYYKGFDENSNINLDYDDIMAMYELYIKRPINEVDPFSPPDEDRRDAQRRDEERREQERRDQDRREQERIDKDRKEQERRDQKRREQERRDKHRREQEQRREQERREQERRHQERERNRYTTRTYNLPTTEPRTRPYYPTTTQKPHYPIRPNRTVTYEGDYEEVDDHLKHDPYRQNQIPMPEICDGFFDAVATLRNEIFIFKDKFIWRLKTMGRVEKGYPVPLKSMFPDLPESIEKIDAAYQRPDGMIVLFTNNMYWVHDGTNLVENSPRPISDYGLSDSLDKIDAVMNWVRNGKTYFYKQDRFWRYNEGTKTMDEGYPLLMDRWRGVPSGLDAATSWNNDTYFFKDELYWKFDNQHIQTVENSPLPIGEIWLGCPENIVKMNRLFGT